MSTAQKSAPKSNEVVNIKWQRYDSYARGTTFYLDAGQGYAVGRINCVNITCIKENFFEAVYTDGYALELIGYFETVAEAKVEAEEIFQYGDPDRNGTDLWRPHFEGRRICFSI